MNKYQEIAATIKNMIANGEYKPNDQLPFEKDMCEKYGASKMTVKKALDMLVLEGLIIKRRGSGTFVKDVTNQQIEDILVKSIVSGFTLSNAGKKISTKVLEFKTLEATKEIANALKIEENEFVCLISRVRSADGQPMVIEKTYLPLNLVSNIKKSDLEGSMYEYLTNNTGLRVQSSHSTVRADKANALDREYLGLKEDEPIIEVERVGYFENGKVFEYSFARHRYDCYEFKAITVN